MKGHEGAVMGVAFAPDGKTVATAGKDGSIRLWDGGTGVERKKLIGHNEEVDCVEFSRDGKSLHSGGVDGTIRVWDVGTGEGRILVGELGAVIAMASSPDGKTLAVGTIAEHNELGLWDLATAKPVRDPVRLELEPRSIGWATGRTVVAVLRQGAIRMWDSNTGKEYFPADSHYGGVLSLAFSADGKCLTSTGGDQTVRTWAPWDGGRQLQVERFAERLMRDPVS